MTERKVGRKQGHLLIATIIVAVACACLTAVGAQAQAPQLLRQFCQTGSKAGECVIPRGLAVDPSSGNLYVADQSNYRIQEFTAWGAFVRAWGWGVIDGSAELQTCTEQTDCGAGLVGSGPGQFAGGALGIAVDSSGSVFAVDGNNHRVQKFNVPSDPQAPIGFELLFGGEVNKTTSGNVCTALSGDICGVGIAADPGPGEGRFGQWPNGSFIAIDLGPTEIVYVGDQERIQKFDTDGNFLGQLEGGPLTGSTVLGLAVDNSSLSPSRHDLYVSFFQSLLLGAQPNVRKLSPAGAQLDTLEVPDPMGVAVDDEGGVFVIAREPGSLVSPRSEILQFTSTGTLANAGFGKDILGVSTGIAASNACGIAGTDLFVSNSEFASSFIALYGPPPDPALCPPPEEPPSIDDQFASSVNSTSANVKAEINPHFWPTTTYYVEYGLGKCSEDNCNSEQPLPPGALLTESVLDGDVSASVALSDLLPDATYHYRFVATTRFEPGDGEAVVRGVGGTEIVDGTEATFHTYPLQPQPKSDCPNQAVRTGRSLSLPDCRAYEIVSPVAKNGGDIAMGSNSIALSSVIGNSATFSSVRSFADPLGAPAINQYLAVRNPGSGWIARSLSAPRKALNLYFAETQSLFKYFSEDLCGAAMLQDTDVPLTEAAPPGVPNLYRRINCGPETDSFRLLTTVPPPGFDYEPSGSFYFPEPQGSSADGGRTVFRADASLTSDACKTPAPEARGIYQLYEQIEGQGLELVSILPTGAANCTHSGAGTWHGPASNSQDSNVHNAVSADGTRVFWTATASSQPATSENLNPGSNDQSGHIYLRANIGSEPSGGECAQAGKACTVKVSEIVSSQPARFWWADQDGTRALFSLDPDGDGPQTENFYEFETFEDEGMIFGTANLVAKGFKGMMGASEDAEQAYFVSTEALGGAASNPLGEEAQAGKPNLYLLDLGLGVKFLGTLTDADVFTSDGTASITPSPVAVLPSRRTSRVSADGATAAFMSTAPLTGFDNSDQSSGKPDSEVFLYDAEANEGSGELLCVSCNSGGSRPSGRMMASRSNGKFQLWAAAQIPGWTEAIKATRLLSASGDRLFFESFDRLLPRDTNKATDVYEWERSSGSQECLEDQGGELYVAQSGGCLSLISSGQSPTDSQLLDASNGGRDVLFATNASLLPQDPGAIDVYDAREGGGFPPPPPPPGECEGASCQNPPPPPQAQAPASSQPGSGNRKVVSVRCPKGKHKQKKAGKVRCAKNKKKKHKSKGARR